MLLQVSCSGRRLKGPEPSGRVVTAKAQGGQASFQGWLEGDEGQQGSCTNRVMEFAARWTVTAMGTGWREQRSGPFGELGDSGDGGEKLPLLGASWGVNRLSYKTGCQCGRRKSGMAPSRSDPSPPSFPDRSSGHLSIHSPATRSALPSGLLSSHHSPRSSPATCSSKASVHLCLPPLCTSVPGSA